MERALLGMRLAHMKHRSPLLRIPSSLPILCLAVLTAGATACGAEPNEGEANASSMSETAMVSCTDGDQGTFGVLPKSFMLPHGAAMPKEGTPEYKAIMEGRCTWVQDTGGTESLFRKLTLKSHGLFDFLLFLDTNAKKYKSSKEFPAGKTLSRGDRFAEIGVINEPGCRESSSPDEYGLHLDTCPHDEHATGIVGVRKKKNPKFDPAKWSLERYIEDRSVEPPYLVGITCGACHVSFNPNSPPKDPAEPLWENLDANIGNQYLHEGRLFGYQLPDSDFRKQVTETQQRGTSDTSRIATDHINNPNTINGLFNLGARATHPERMADGQVADVPHILKDGADSVGIIQAMLRVHVNIGMCSDQWLAKHDALDGKDPQKPLLLSTLEKECPEYSVMKKKMSNQALFLSQAKPFKLAKEHLLTDAIIGRGAKAFAKACATCHSSKQPPNKGEFNQATGTWTMSDEAIGEWFASRVVDSNGNANPAFLEGNYLADDALYPVGYLKTNAARSLATNALAGHVWEEFSSDSYKQSQHVPATIDVDNPMTGDVVRLTFGKGLGFYRTPALTALWTSAPFLHNNSLGLYNGDPSVAGRLRAFNDAARELLWPDTRKNVVKTTDRDTTMSLPYWPDLRIKKGVPVNVFAHLDPRESKTRSTIVGYAAKGLLQDLRIEALTDILLRGQAPDLVENKGHYFGSERDPSPFRRLTDAERRDLIEYLKTL